jgi:hypothetical protein
LNEVLKNNKVLNSYHLATALGWLEPQDLNVMLTSNENGVLGYLVAAAKDRSLDWATVLTELRPEDLNMLLTAHDEVLDSLRKNPRYLAQVLFSHESENAAFMEEKIEPYMPL